MTANADRISLGGGDGHVFNLNSGVGCTTLTTDNHQQRTLKRQILRYVSGILVVSIWVQKAGGWPQEAFPYVVPLLLLVLV